MGTLRFDHVAVVVDDLEAVTAFFVDLGFERQGGTVVEGEVVDEINGLGGVRAELVMVQTPDGSGKLEIVKYHTPADTEGAQSLPANRLGLRHVCIEVEDLDMIVDRFREQGLDTVGEIRDYGDSYRLCYLRGPEGLIVELAERICVLGKTRRCMRRPARRRNHRTTWKGSTRVAERLPAPSTALSRRR